MTAEEPPQSREEWRPGPATPLGEFEAALERALPSVPPSPEWSDAQRDIGEAGSLFGFASIYEEAARVLTLHAGEHRLDSYRAKQATAVVFLHRHCLELILKQTVLALQEQARVGLKPPRTHRLMPLWNAVREHLRPLLVDPDRELRALDLSVRLFERVDPSSESSRYPIDVNGRPLAPLPPVDLAALQEVVMWFMDTMTVCLGRMGLPERTWDPTPERAEEG